MREHAIPQAVTSYEFHLIGNMTLKQFLELASGFFFAFLVYSTNLPGIIKWPIVIVLVALGAMIAFVPFEGRPLDQWVFALVRAIYKPTEFYWRKSETIPDYFTYTAGTHKQYKEELDLTPIKQKRIQEYITTLPSTIPIDPIDAGEMSRMNSVMSLFNEVGVAQVSAQPMLAKPDVNENNTHSLQPMDQVMDSVQNREYAMTNSDTVIPQNTPIEVEQTIEPEIVDPMQGQAEEVNVFSSSTAELEVPQQTQVAQTSSDLPFPQKPTQPNIVVGMVFDAFGNIVENAIVEISDQQGMPVRAVRTNAIGQFSISTPLADGQYVVTIEKDGLSFQALSLELAKSMVDPLAIRAQA